MQSKGNAPTAAQKLRKLFHYDPYTGIFTRRIRMGKMPARKVAEGSKERGYRRICFDGTQHYAHRLAWLYVYGEWPVDQIDHKNHVRHDNRIGNLRSVGHIENHRNVKRSKANTSGHTGVWWHGQNNRWCAEIKVNRKKISLGCFENLVEAISARKSAEQRYGFHQNHGALHAE